jgi:hypothetical protein
VGAELALEALGGAVGERKDHYAGCVAVEPVDNQHAAMAAATAFDFCRGPGENRVLLAGKRGVDEQPGGLDDDNDVVVQMCQLDRRSRRRTPPSRRIGPVLDPIGRVNERARLHHHLAVDEDVAHLDLTLGVRVRRPQPLLDDPAEALCGRFHAARVAPPRALLERCSPHDLWTVVRLSG